MKYLRQNRNPITTLIAITLACSGWFCGRALAADAEYDAIRRATQQVAKSVVQIELIGASRSDGELTLDAPISGMVIDADGHIVTSLWGLAETPASILIVSADGSRLPAELVARDHSRELALLRVKPNDAISPVDLTNIVSSSSQLQVGQWAISVGRGITPEQPAVSIGIVSAMERMYGRAIQIDARVSPSFYGGPVVDIRGRLMGLSVPMKPEAGSAGEKSGWYDSGIAFVIPIDAIVERLDRLRSGKDIYAGKLGIVPSSKMPFSDDCTLSAVLALSPAKRVGMQAGDELIAIAGQPVRRNADIKQLLGPRDAGEKLKIKIRRDEKELEFEPELAAEIPTFKPRVLGVLARSEAEQAVIDFVFPESAAAKAKLAVGDVLAQIGGKPIESIDRARLSVMTHPPGENLKVQVLRDGKPLDFDCDLQWTPETVVESLPQREATVKTEDWEIVPRTLPDVPNKSVLLKPKPKVSQIGLVVLLARPGTEDLDELVDGWRPIAVEHQLAVLAVGAAESKRWKPVEGDVVVRMIQQVQKILPVMKEQIVVGGFGAGAEMAMMVGLRNREILRGVIAASGSRPGGFALRENDPAEPVQILVVGGKAMPIWGRVLANAGYPVIQEPSEEKNPLGEDADVQQAVARWIRSLSRL